MKREFVSALLIAALIGLPTLFSPPLPSKTGFAPPARF
jgi:hypothetical protein